MKRILLFLSMLLLATTLCLERSGLLWRYERPVIHFLARATQRSLPTVTTVSMALTQSLLTPQDVALTMRAIISFNPHQILIAEEVGDLSNGPFSLIREAEETGELQKIPVVFAFIPKDGQKNSGLFTNLLVFPEETSLPFLKGKGTESSCFGFINKENRKVPLMPLFAKDADEKIIGSLWWRGILSFEKEVERSMHYVLLEGRFLFLPSHRTLALQKGADLPLIPTKEGPTLLLEDLLLHREEMERGIIRADLDPLFRGKTVLLGGEDVATEGAALQDAQEQFVVGALSPALYGGLLLLLSLFVLLLISFSWIDFLLLVCGMFFLYGIGGYWLFRLQGVLLPLFLPLALVLIAVVKKIPSCTWKIKK